MKYSISFTVLIITLVLGLTLPSSSSASMICVSDINGDGVIDTSSERWACLGSGTNYVCPYRETDCTYASHDMSGFATSTNTGISGRVGLSSFSVGSLSSGFDVLAWQCSSSSGCSQVSVGHLNFANANVSGGAKANVITKLVGSGNHIDVYGCTGDTCNGTGELVGTLTVQDASFSGTAIAPNGIVAFTTTSFSITFSGLTCSDTSGCTEITAGSILMSPVSYTCPLGSGYTCANDGGTYRCSDVPCYDDSTVSSSVCGYDVSGDGVIDLNTETKACVGTGSSLLCPINTIDCASGSIDPYCPSDGTSCPSGGTYNSTSKKCEAGTVANSFVCPLDGQNYYVSDLCNSNCKLTGTCSEDRCPLGSYSCVNGSCSETAKCSSVNGCPDGYSLASDQDKCLATPVGASYLATLNKSSDKCEFPFSPACITGFSYDASNKLCLDNASSYYCADGYTMDTSTNKCTRSPDCLTPGSFNTSTGMCSASPTATTSCTSGTYDAVKGLCVLQPTYTCPSGMSWNATYNYCTTSAAITCASGYAYNSARGMCEAAPSCSAGSYSTTYHVCVLAPGSTYPSAPSGFYAYVITPSCQVSGMTYALACAGSDPNAVCNGGLKWPGYGCPSGWTKIYGGDSCGARCMAYGTLSCSAGTYNSAVGLCIVNPTCASGGSHNASLDVCQLSPSISCSAGTYNSSWNLCYADPVSITCSAGTYNSTYKLCTLPAVSTCPASYAWNSTRSICETSPSCPSGSTFSSSLNLCLADRLGNCPDGTSYSTSLQKCYHNQTATCPTDYTLNGLTCTASPLCLSGSYDSLTDQCTGVIACPYGSQYACVNNSSTGTSQCSNILCSTPGTSAPITESADLRSYTNDGKTGAKGCEGTLFVFNGKGSECRPAGVNTNFFSCCNESEDAFLIIKERCSDMDYRTVAMKNKKLCHPVGTYCQTKWPLLGCVQSADTYCCFSSKLSRILHEQGRQQLKSFTSLPDGIWGAAQSPNCRGFTVDEFAMLDFSRIDLSEYFTEITEKVSAKIPSVVEGAKSKVKTFFENSIKQ